VELQAIPAFLGEADIFQGLAATPWGGAQSGKGTSGMQCSAVAKTDQNLY